MTIAEEGTDISLLQKDITIHTVKYADKNISGVTVTKTHVKHHTYKITKTFLTLLYVVLKESEILSIKLKR